MAIALLFWPLPLLPVPSSENLVLPTVYFNLQGLCMVPRRTLGSPKMLPNALHTQLCSCISILSCLPSSQVLGLASLCFWKGPWFFPPECHWTCYSLSLECPHLYLVNSFSLIFISSTFSLWSSAPCLLPLLCSINNILFSVTWTLGIPGKEYFSCKAMICWFNQFDGQTLGSLRKKPCLFYVYTIMPSRGCGTHLVFKKPCLVHANWRQKQGGAKQRGTEIIISGKSGQEKLYKVAGWREG